MERIASSAAASCPLPPSITTRFGIVAKLSSHRCGSALSREPREAPGDHLPHRREVVLAVQPSHRERAVVPRLRLRVDEDRHRRDDVPALDVRDVEALDPDRQALEVEALAQALERLDPPQALLLRRGLLVTEREPGVLVGELRQPLLLASSRRPNLDGGAAQLGQEAGERLGVGDVGRDDHLRRHARRGRVVLEAEPLQDRRPVLAFDVLEVVGVAVDQLAVAQREQLHGGVVAGSTASPITSIVPTARLSAAWRSARLSIANSRLRQRAASS